jgi:hypothetical protein
MFNMNSKNFVGPMSLDGQEEDLRKNKMLAGMLQRSSQQSAENASPDSTSGGLNIANSLVAGLGAAYLANKNGQDENLLKKNKALAGILGGI